MAKRVSERAGPVAPASGGRRRGGRRGFSMVEMLLALAISAALLAATLAAFDAAWRGYKVTTESASTHVVSRIVVHRMLAMVRTGTEFGPFPGDYFDPAQNPVVSNYMEFISEEDRLAGINRITRIEKRVSDTNPNENELWYVRLDADTNPPTVLDERPLLRGVREALFILEYRPGPRLVKATIDLTVEPAEEEAIRTGGTLAPPAIRLVASAEPRQFDGRR